MICHSYGKLHFRTVLGIQDTVFTTRKTAATGHLSRKLKLNTGKRILKGGHLVKDWGHRIQGQGWVHRVPEGVQVQDRRVPRGPGSGS